MLFRRLLNSSAIAAGLFLATAANAQSLTVGTTVTDPQGGEVGTIGSGTSLALSSDALPKPDGEASSIEQLPDWQAARAAASVAQAEIDVTFTSLSMSYHRDPAEPPVITMPEESTSS